MKKTILPFLLLICLLLNGCGENDSKAAYTLSHGDELLASGAFEGSEMAPLDLDIVSMLYGIDRATITEGVCYMAVNTSASADELLVLVLNSEEAAIAAEEACRTRVENQIAVCESYCPQAVPRLEKAFISRRGYTLLMAVGDPDIIASLSGIQ